MALTTAQRLEEAKEALHKLLTGTKVVSAGFEGRQVQYRAQDIPALKGYIRELEAELDSTVRRPFGVAW